MADVVLSWKLHTRADLRTTWALFSDTDRFNRVAGVGLHFEVDTSGDEMRRLGWARRMGLRIDWEEMPFEYEAPEWFVSVRKFTAGPARELRARLALTPAEDGTDIDYSVSMTPRNMLAWAVLNADAQLSTRPQLGRALAAAVAHLDDPDASYDPPPPPLTPEASSRLDRALESVSPGALRRELARRIRHDPLFRQQRISPLAVARRLELDADEVIAGFLDAVRAGALALRWELLCPRCQGPKRVLDQLDPRPGDVHCPTCNITYDGSFPDSVAVRFEPTPAIRDVDVPIECLLSPARTPHIVANRRVGGEPVVLTVPLEPGGYLIRTDPPIGLASLEVRDGARSRTVSLDLDRDGPSPEVLRVGPGEVAVHVRSRLGRDVLVSIERRWRPEWALTAGRLLELPGARDVLAESALRPGLQVQVAAQTVVCIEVLQADPEVNARIEAVCTKRAPRALHRSDDRWVVTWDDEGSALDVAEALDADPRLAVGLARGPVAAIGDPAVPSGSAVEAAVRAGREAGAGRTVIADPWPIDPERAQVGADGLVAFASTTARRQARFQALLEDPPPPESVGDWAIGEQLGEGGFGVVFGATGPGGEGVVKLLRTDRAHDPEHAQQFYNEARITASLQHPNTVRVLDWGHTRDGRLYLAMERLMGHELADDLGDDGVMDPQRACWVAIQALDSLAEAHDAGVVHRDIKPENVFLCTDGRAKVIDFGIARPIDAEVTLEEQQVVLGTPAWLSPEQVDREPLDGRSDAYAVGLLLYRALSGRLPFVGNNPLAVALQRTVKDPPAIDEVTEQELPAGLAEVVMKALAREPTERWATADAMREALVDLVPTGS